MNIEHQLKSFRLSNFSISDLEYHKHELKSILQEQPNKGISVDGVSATYFDNRENDVITLYNFKTSQTLTATINDNSNAGFIKSENYCNYFADKKISIQEYSNITLDRNNFIIPMFNSQLELAGQQNIWFDFKENCYRKHFKDGITTKGLFYYHGDFDNAEIAVLSEGVADSLAFINFFKNNFPDKSFLIVSAMSVGNLEETIKILKLRNPLIKTIFYLIDRDHKFQQVIKPEEKYLLIDDGISQKTFEKISKLSIGHTILFPVSSLDEKMKPNITNGVIDYYKYSVKDFSDMLTAPNNELEILSNNIKQFFTGRLFLNADEISQIKNAKTLNGNDNSLNPIIINLVLRKLNLYKYRVFNGDIYLLNPDTATYQELAIKTADDILEDINHPVYIIPNFISYCSKIAPQKFLTNNLVKLKETIFELLKSSQEHLAIFEQGINLKNGSVSFEKLIFDKSYIKTTQFLPWRFYSDEEYQEKFNGSIVQKFLTDILPEPDDYLQLEESIGNIFSPGRRDKMVYLLGSGSNGKSLLLNLLMEAFGKYSASINLDDILINPNSRVGMVNKLVIVSPEFSGNIKDLQIFKTLVSRESIPVRQLYKDVKSISGLPVPIIASNDLPMLSATNNSTAFIRRIAPLKMTQTFEQNITFEKNIRKPDNIEIFFNWCIRCTFRMTNDKSTITLSPNSQKLLDEIRNKVNSVSAFLDENGIKPGTCEVSASSLYEWFNRYCESNGFSVCSSTSFGLKLADLKLKKKTVSGRVCYLLNKSV